MTRKQKRLSVILAGLLFLGAASGLTFYALGRKASHFHMPADLAAANVPPGQRIRLDGLVEKGTIIRVGRCGRLLGHRHAAGRAGRHRRRCLRSRRRLHRGQRGKCEQIGHMAAN
nr:cytochrome c maturation protein CcmE [Mesorhizobium hawassense]